MSAQGPRPPGKRLPVAFFARDTLLVARELLGKLLCRRDAAGRWMWGRIVETEAYVGEDDPACHGASGWTPRTRVLYGPPGRSYVYFTYGMHHLFNAVTEREGFPAAVLIRALEPLGGVEQMQRNRGGRSGRDIASGPARLCQALAIDLTDNDRLLAGSLHLRDAGLGPAQIRTGPRIGIRRATDRPWRFWEAGNPHVSRPA